MRKKFTPYNKSTVKQHNMMVFKSPLAGIHAIFTHFLRFFPQLGGVYMKFIGKATSDPVDVDREPAAAILYSNECQEPRNR